MGTAEQGCLIYHDTRVEHCPIYKGIRVILLVQQKGQACFTSTYLSSELEWYKASRKGRGGLINKGTAGDCQGSL